MAGQGVKGLNEAFRALSIASRPCKRAVTSRAPSQFSRTMATEAPLPNITTSVNQSVSQFQPRETVPLTIHAFPSFEPTSLESWSAKHLHLPLRRDILHLAVTYEGDATRQGTASSKTRWEVHGSHRKMRPQKGSGRARVGTKQSPTRRGGGKAFGPKPRDFSTNLNRKVYDLAWRTALSYRYRRGELIVCEDGMELPLPEEFAFMVQDGLAPELQNTFKSKWAQDIMQRNEWGRGFGRSTFITSSPRDNLWEALERIPNYGRALDIEDVDVKDLLETGRLVIERQSLKDLLETHQSDLITQVFVNGVRAEAPGVDKEVIVQ